MCRGDHWSPANLVQQRVFQESIFTEKRAGASNARPCKSFWQPDRAVSLFRNLPSIVICLNRAVILCPPRRVGQVLNIVANCENHLVGDKPLVHQIQNEQVRHLADDELRFICLIHAMQKR